MSTAREGGAAIRTLQTQVGEVKIHLPRFEDIPDALKQLPFAVWIAEPELNEDGNQKCKPNGRPCIKKAPRHLRGHYISKSKPEQWMGYQDCARSFDPKRFYGVGVLLEASSGIVGIDLDDYIAMAANNPAIKELMQRAQQAGIYCEASPSRTGVRLFVKGTLPDGKGRRWSGIELYANAAFLTVTGRIAWPGGVLDGQWLVDELLETIESSQHRAEADAAQSNDTAETADPAIVGRLSTEMAQKQPRLWQGRWQPDGGNINRGYSTQSEADFALCGHILRAAVGGGISRSALAATIAEVFHRSDLYRPEKEKTLRSHTIPNLIKHHFEAETAPTGGWKEMRPLPSALPPSPVFDLELLPSALRAFVEDVATRMQVPVEIVATPLLISLGSVIGKKLAIQPFGADASWYEYANLWGVAVLQPGMLKSPALNEGTKFIRELEDIARGQYETEFTQWQSVETLRKIVQKDVEAKVRKLFKDGKCADAQVLAETIQAGPKSPVRKRYIIMDATPEARLRMLGENPNGVMLIRDELSGHIAQLHRDGYEQARAQELQFYDGKFNYEDDRLKREGMFASEPRMAMYGNLQPSKVEALNYVRSQAGKGQDDGYLERLFQLAVMFSLSTEYVINKRQPDEDAEARVRLIFKTADDLPGERDATGVLKPRRLVFDPLGQKAFDSVFETLERILRKPGGSEQLKSHKGKFRGTLVKLALILAFCEDVQLTAIPIEALKKAIKLMTFYLKHAERIYALGEPSDLGSAQELLGRIKARQMQDGFAARDVEMNKWKWLRTLGEIEGAIAVLCDHGYLLERRDTKTGGAPSRKLFINPAVERKAGGKAA